MGELSLSGEAPARRDQGGAARPPVAVVMPFAGTPAEAQASLAALGSLRTRPGDRLVLADNSGTVPVGGSSVAVLRADGERSPARARNAGAAETSGEWLLFLDADCRPAPDLLDAFFGQPIPAGVAAIAGEIDALPGGASLASRYGASRNFLGSSTHLAHPFRPRVAAANLLVRRAAFDAVGGFREGIRAAEDTDFCWRLQNAGWTLAVCPQARAGHGYRSSLTALRRQWRGYAAGRAWLGRTYEGFHPEPALKRALRRVGLGALPGVGRAAPTQGPVGEGSGRRLPNARVNPGTPPRSARERLEFLFVDVVLGIEELRGLRDSNDPH